MANFALGKKALGTCDICGQTYKLKTLKAQIVKQRPTGLLACAECWSPDHPQLMLGTFKIVDPQALRNPRSDSNQRPSSRNTQWGWNPVGFQTPYSDTPNALLGVGEVGTVSVVIT